MEKKVILIQDNYITVFNYGVFYDLNEEEYCYFEYFDENDECVKTVHYLTEKDKYIKWAFDNRYHDFFDKYIDKETNEGCWGLKLKPNHDYIAIKNKKKYHIKTDDNGGIKVGIHYEIH